MRRGRDVRDHRDALNRKALTDKAQRRKAQVSARHKAVRDKAKQKHVTQIVNDKSNSSVRDFAGINLERFENYQCLLKEPINVCHIIESLGMGGGQTMMMELIRGLNTYYEGKIVNHVVCPRSAHSKYEKGLYQSYGVTPIVMREKELTRFLSKHSINIVLQHRLAVSKCLKSFLISNVKYVLMNHTFHQLSRMPGFLKCDYYVSVCEYLDRETRWPSYMQQSRRAVVLNGVENDYLNDIEPVELAGGFKTGRCHRLVQSKFKADTIPWFDGKVAKHLPEHRHYLIGHNVEAKKFCKNSGSSTYFGSTPDRVKKMSILKALDLYFYETFTHEGASIAILESLACGVPVVCKNYGGNSELIKNGVNGYIVNDRSDFLTVMKDLYNHRDKLGQLKESTKEDFQKRLHVRYTAAKYMQIFEGLMK